jgi:hypothetical protein
VSKFDSGCGPLVGHDAAAAEADFRGAARNRPEVSHP